MGRLQDKVVLVTGGTSGIGTEIVRKVAEEGAFVGVAGRSASRGNQVVAQIGERAMFVELDVGSGESWQGAMEQLLSRFGGIDVLVNNAGVMSSNTIESILIEEFDTIMGTNAGGIILGCKTAIGLMKSSGQPASIVNVLSTTSIKTSAWTLAYGASKAAALSLTRSMALHCAEQGYAIRCNAILPGVVMTPMVESLLDAADDREAALAGLTATHPIGRLIEGEEVANAVVYFASEDSSGVTGSFFAVDGGATAA